MLDDGSDKKDSLQVSMSAKLHRRRRRSDSPQNALPRKSLHSAPCPLSASPQAPNVETCSPEIAPRCQLEILEVDMVEIQFPILREPADIAKKISPAQEIYQTINNGKKMILSL